MKSALIVFALSGQLYADTLKIACDNHAGLTESLSVVQTESTTKVSIKSLKAKELLEKLLGERSISGLVTKVDFTIPRSCKISKAGAFSFYCPARNVTLTFSGDQVVDVRNQDIGLGTLYALKITSSYREESVLVGLSVYTTPQPSYPGLSTTFLTHESHSGELSDPGKSIMGKKCSVSSAENM